MYLFLLAIVVLPRVLEVSVIPTTLRTSDRLTATPDPDRRPAPPSRLRQAHGDVRHPLRRPPYHRQEEKGALEKGDIVRSGVPALKYFKLLLRENFE